MSLEQTDVIALTHAANDAFTGELMASIPKANLTQKVIGLLEKIQSGEATVDEINSYREAINTDANTPILSQDAFRGNAIVAAEMSLESMSDTVDNVIESVARFIRKLWEFIKGLLERFRGMLNKLLLSLQKKSKDIATHHYTNDVDDINENYITIKDHSAKMSFYTQAANDYTSDILTTTRTVKTMFEKCFIPMLRSELAAGENISELSNSVLDYIAQGNRDSARVNSEKISQVFNEQARKVDELLKPYSGYYINGIEITRGGENLRFKVNPVTAPSKPFRIKALGAADLEQLLGMAIEITKDLKDVADADYKRLQRIYNDNSKNIEEFVNGYSAAKKSNNTLKRKDYELLQVTVTKGVNHFQKITSAISSTMNTLGRFAWTVEDVFYKENIRILENIKNKQTGKVSLENDQPTLCDNEKVCVIDDEVSAEIDNVKQELMVNNQHYLDLIDRLRKHIGAIDPSSKVTLMDNAAYSYQNFISADAVNKGIGSYLDYVNGIQEALVTDNLDSWIMNTPSYEFIGGGVSNGILFKNVSVDVTNEFTLNDINTILTNMATGLTLVKSTLGSYVPKINNLAALVKNTAVDLTNCKNGSLVEKSAILRRLVKERNKLLSNVNLLAVNAYLYDAIDEFTEAVFRELYIQ